MLLALSSELKYLVEIGGEALRGGDLDALCSLCYEVVLARAAGRIRFLQIRYAGILVEVLRRRAEALTLVAPCWRTMVAALRAVALQPVGGFEGVSLTGQFSTTLLSIIKHSRRWFAAGACDEIVDELLGAAERTRQTGDGMEAFLLLGALLPTRGAGAVSSRWDSHVARVLALWRSASAGSQTWDNCAVALLGRIAKASALRVTGGHPHGIAADTWGRCVQLVCNASLSALKLPIGGASGGGGGSRAAPKSAMVLATRGSVQGNAAKVLVYTLGRAGVAAGGAAHCAGALAATASELEGDGAAAGAEDAMVVERGAEGDAGCCASLEHACMLIALIEQFAHPSNGGSWSSAIGRLLEDLGVHLLGRRALEASYGAHADPAVAESAPTPMPRQCELALAHVLLDLCERSMHSKSSSLRAGAASTLVRLSELLPRRVFPLIVETFDSALGSETSPHQLNTAIRLMGWSSRPLMLYTQTIPMAGGVCVTGPEALVAALSAVLPGLDANDSSKAMRSMTFICSALSACAPADRAAAKGGGALPLPWDEWSEELLTRVLLLMSHVDEGRGPPGREGESDAAALEDPGSFLMEDDSMFRTMLELVFHRMPRACRSRSYARLARWLLSKDLSGIPLEAGVMMSAAVYIDPTMAVEVVGKPLLEGATAAMRELAADADSGGEGGHSRSMRSHVKKAGADIEVLSMCLPFAGPALVPIGDTLLECLRLALRSPHVALSKTGSRLNMCVLSALSGCYPMDEYRCVAGPLADSTGCVFSRGDASALEASAPHWHTPNDAERALCDRIIADCLRKPLEEMRSFVGGEAPASRDAVRAVLLCVESTLGGLGNAIPDFDPVRGGGGGGPDARPLPQAPRVLVHSFASAALRTEAASTLHAARAFVCDRFGDDTVALKLLINAMDSCLNACANHHYEYGHGHSCWKHHDAQMFAVDTAMPGGFAGELGAPKPTWLMTEAVYLAYTFRLSQTTYRTFSGYNAPDPPQIALDLANDLVLLSMHGYLKVGSTASAAVERTLRRFPQAIAPSVALALARLADARVPADAAEGVVAGATNVLLYRCVGRWLCATGNGAKLDEVLRTLCFGTAHHDLPQLQAAIHKKVSVHLVMRMPSVHPECAHVVAAGANAGLQHVDAIAEDDSMHTGEWSLIAESVDESEWDKEAQAALRALRNGVTLACERGDWSSSMCAHLASSLIGPAGAGTNAATAAEQKQALHWRYAQLAHMVLAARASAGYTAADARALASLSLMNFASREVPQLRHMAAAGLAISLQRGSDIAKGAGDIALANEAAAAAAAVVRDALRASKGALARALVQSVVLEETASVAHARTGGGNDSAFTLGLELIARAHVSSNQNRLESSCRVPAGAVVTTRSDFAEATAGLFQLIASAAGPRCLMGFAAPLAEHLAKSDIEPGTNAAVATMAAGLLLSALEVTLVDSDGGADADAARRFVQTLGAAARDAALRGVGGAAAASEWKQCVRYALVWQGGGGGSDGGEGDGSGAASAAEAVLLEVLLTPLPNGAAAAAHARRLGLIAAALAEVGARPTRALGFKRAVLDELRGFLRAPGAHAAREEAGRCLALLLCSVLEEDPSGGAEDTSCSELATECEATLRGLVADMEGWADEIAAMGTQAGAESNGARISADASTKQGGGGPSGGKADDGSADGLNEEQRLTLQRIEVVLFAMRTASRCGHVVPVAPLFVSAFRWLPLVGAAPDEDFKLVAARAASDLKHINLPEEALRAAAAGLAATVASAANWRARASALTLAQQLVFRRSATLGGVAVEALRVAASDACADERSEVRELAASSLSGILRVGGGAALDRERSAAEEAVRAGTRALRKARRRKAREAAAGGRGSDRKQAASAALAGAPFERHASLLRLAACLQSRPYDVDPWMPAALMAMADAVSEPAPVRDAVKNAFQEFRRTHNDTWETHVLPAFDQDQLEVIKECASGQGAASYFV